MSLNCHYRYLVSFKSPRDSSQINHLAKQMFPGHVKYMQESFQDATSRPYGYLLCDSVCLCQKSIKRLNHIVKSQFSMAQRLRRNHDFLKLLAKCTPAQHKAILKEADDALVKTICERILNVLKETVPISKPAKRKLLAQKTILDCSRRKKYSA